MVGEMSNGLQQRRERSGKGVEVTEKVVVAVKASKEISKNALVWALTHVVQPGDCLTLLVVMPPLTSGRKLWGFPRFAGDCASGHRRSHTGTTLEQKSDLTNLCSQMMLQLQDVYDPNKINVKVKVVSGSPSGVVAAECKRAHASWVVLDKQLKHEEKRCTEELQCNIVVMKRSQPKVLRLNLIGSPDAESPEPCPLPPELDLSTEEVKKDIKGLRPSTQGPTVTPSSSPEVGTSFTATEAGTSSVSSSDPGTSPFFISETNGCIKKAEKVAVKEDRNLDVTSSGSDSESSSPSTTMELQPWMAEILSVGRLSSKHVEGISHRLNDSRISKAKTLLEKYSKPSRQVGNVALRSRSEWDFSGNVREAVPITRNPPPGPPPLCSICQHKAPVFGKPPRWFSYAELELATGGFSQANFLAEGGFGSVHRGVLPDGQAIAVKQHKLASSQGDHEFCSEVEVLSCAQHRNVVMLIGFCVEDRRRLLVYEYICNGSLDSHLYGRNQEPLAWSARQKIAVGAARGLRYLHEECRVGCIVHRDMRPNNILITHDFESLVGDFGLARWQPDGDLGVETRVIGTFGYLAPEYAQSGQITEKADVYSFGVVLVELVTGRKAVDINRPKGQQCLTEWARPLLEGFAIDELIDPCLENCFSEHEVYCMLHAASLCIRRDPHARPKMSQVLRILEGDLIMDSSYILTLGGDVGSRSGRMCTEQQAQCGSQVHHTRSNSLGGDKSSEFLRTEREREREGKAKYLRR
ncbi:Inactive protein kinase [Apostasia shenzhenica]|uniref:Inactive protein kinase n=1 Tax=Apostasia shenzhenica TaxID=1088818 RepID=A0A2I0ANR8_9ASPA|nr:Inactive protein kinase [Apostasia shenzhenica]